MFVPDNKSKDTDVKSQMQNIKEEREFMRKLEATLGTKKGLPKLRGEHVYTEVKFYNNICIGS